MIGGGIASFAFGLAAGGLWLAFVGWFLNMAAQAEARHMVLRERLAGLRVRDLMVPDPVYVGPDVTVGRLMDAVAFQHRHSSYPVVDGERLVGLVSFRRVAATPRAEWDERRVRDCMIPLDEVPTLTADDEATVALDRVAQSDLGRALVVDDGTLVGLVSVRDLVREIQRRG